MKYLFYTNSQTAWSGLYAAMEQAEKSIYIEMYIFVDDTEMANNFIDLLTEKSKNGVQIKIVLDWFGSFSLSGQAQEKMRAAGVEILFFKKLLRRMHHKVVIVDETVGFLGGVNIHREARLWNDLLVRLEGPIINSLLRSFRRFYKLCGGKDQKVLAYKRKAVLGHTRIWLLEHIPFIRKPRLRDTYTEAIFKAKEKIILVTPYFVPSRWLIKLLRETCARGVRVEVILPEKTDSDFISRANRRYMNLLYGSGVEFFLLPKMNHAKILLVDKTLAIMGSANLDAMSFDFNVETNVSLTDQKMISDISEIINVWKAQAKIFKPSRRTDPIDFLFSLLVKILQPFL